MPSATLTTREVKNKATGIDISIPTYKETATLLASTVEFNVVVSRLGYFKSPKHKESDVVQFMIPRKYPDFEHLHQQLGKQFPATILPLLPKKVLRLTEAVIKDRKSKLESFLKFLACTPKISTSSKLLEFLGVNAIKAGRYRKGVVDESDKKQTEEGEHESLDNVIEQDVITMETEEDLFGEEDTVEDTGDMFTSEDMEDSLTADTQATRSEAKLFDDPDLGGGLDEGEADLLGFVPDALVSNQQRPLATVAIDDEHSDLLQIDDDLDKLLVIDRKNPASTDIPTEPAITMAPSEQVKDTKLKNTKPTLPVKPSPPSKPIISKKPNIGDKPQILGKKPMLPRKPSKETTDTKTVQQREITTGNKGDNSTNLEEISAALDDNDLLKYIEDNSAAGEEDLDLFS